MSLITVVNTVWLVSSGSFMDDQLGLLVRYQNASLQAKEAVSSAFRLSLLCLSSVMCCPAGAAW